MDGRLYRTNSDASIIRIVVVIILLPRDATHNAVLPWQVVCPSVCIHAPVHLLTQYTCLQLACDVRQVSLISCDLVS